MKDRELLELAAKACGYDTSHRWNAERLAMTPPVAALCIDGVSTGWNPLADNGDALRLAIQCELSLVLTMNGAKAAREDGVFAEEYSKDSDAATRLAIVLAAAEIGKAMI